MNGRQEPERVPGKQVVLVLGGVVAVASIAVGVEALMLKRAQEAQLQRALPRAAASVGDIQQRTFEKSAVAAELKAAQLSRLSSYGWIDRARGVVHLPIERATDLWIDRNADRARQGSFQPGPKSPGAELQRTEPGRLRRDRTSRPGAAR